MNKNRLSPALASALNAQMTKEAYASQIYLSFASWADTQGFEGVATFLFRHANEERNHMMKILEYILKRGAKAEIVAIPVPHENPESLFHCFEKIYEHEVDNTKAIYKLVNMSLGEEDWATWNFLQWFVSEQVEEETLALQLIDKIRIAGGEKISHNTLYVLDKDMGNNSGSIKSALEATTDNP